MTVIVEVTALPVEEFSGISAKNGKPYSMRKQVGYLFTEGNPYPDKFSIMLQRDMVPYAAGKYELSPQAVYVDRNGNLAIDPRFQPIKSVSVSPVSAIAKA